MARLTDVIRKRNPQCAVGAEVADLDLENELIALLDYTDRQEGADILARD